MGEDGRRAEAAELEDLQRHREDLGEPTAARRSRHDEPKLKGSIGEGPNHSNFSDQSSVRIQEILLEFIRDLKKSGMLNIFDKIWRNSNKFSSTSEQILMKNIRK